MYKSNIVSPEGLRIDGRRPTELRRIQCKTSVFSEADGSAYIQQGNTKCFATVFGPREISRKSTPKQEKAILNVKFSTASFSTGQRKKQQKMDKRLLELASTIKKIFENVIMVGQFPRSEVDISLQILQIDGGTLHVAINATTLALIDAGIPMLDYVLACSAGFVDDQAILDLNITEENADVPTLTLALLPKSGKVAMTGLESRIHLDNLEQVISLATDGCLQLFSFLDNAIRDNVKELAMKSLVY
ncbi:Exosome complex component RRP41 [Lobulomyces angularis]|nr:Exosome complex component RRP41 [Lobulomyces angularis]